MYQFIKKYNDYKYVLERVKKNGNELYFASSNLKDNYNIVLNAILNDSSSLKYASKRLRANHDIIKIAISKNGIDIENAIGVNDNFEIVSLAVKNNGYAIKFVSYRLKNNEKIAILAGSDNIQSLNYTPINIRRNRKIVNQCIKNINNIIYKPLYIIKIIDFKNYNINPYNINSLFLLF